MACHQPRLPWWGRVSLAILSLACIVITASSQARGYCQSGAPTAILYPVSPVSFLNSRTGDNGWYGGPYPSSVVNTTCTAPSGLALAVELIPQQGSQSAPKLCLTWLGSTGDDFCQGAQLLNNCLQLQPEGTSAYVTSSWMSGYLSTTTNGGASLVALPNGRIRYSYVSFSSNSMWEVSAWRKEEVRLELTLKVVSGCLLGSSTAGHCPPGSPSSCQPCQPCARPDLSPRRCPSNSYLAPASLGSPCLPARAGYNCPDGCTSAESCVPGPRAQEAFEASWTCFEQGDTRLGQYQATPFRWDGANPQCPSLDGRSCLLGPGVEPTPYYSPEKAASYVVSCRSLLSTLPALQKQGKLKTLSCGRQYQRVYGYSGYTYPNSGNTGTGGHFCNVAWEVFVGYPAGRHALQSCEDCRPLGEDGQTVPYSIDYPKTYVDVMGPPPAAVGDGRTAAADVRAPGGYGGSDGGNSGGYGGLPGGPGTPGGYGA